MAVSGEEVGTFDEVKRIVERSPGETLKFKVFRENRHMEVEVVVQERRRKLELDVTQRYGAIGIQPNAPSAVVGIASTESPAYRAGLRTFDVITYVAGRPIRRFTDLEKELGNNRGVTIPVTYMRPQSVPGALGGLADMAVFEAGVVSLTPHVQGESFTERTGLELADRYAASVPRGSYLYQAGLRPGDRIVALDGQSVPAWSTFVDRLASSPDRSHRIDFISARDNLERSGDFRVRREDFIDESGQRYSRYVLPCGSWANLVQKGRIWV